MFEINIDNALERDHPHSVGMFRCILDGLSTYEQSRFAAASNSRDLLGAFKPECYQIVTGPSEPDENGTRYYCMLINIPGTGDEARDDINCTTINNALVLLQNQLPKKIQTINTTSDNQLMLLADNPATFERAFHYLRKNLPELEDHMPPAYYLKANQLGQNSRSIAR